MLVEDTLRSSTQYLTAVRREETAEHRAKTFHGLVLCSKLQTAVRWITEREEGRRASAGRPLHKDGGSCVRGASRETPRRTAPV